MALFFLSSPFFFSFTRRPEGKTGRREESWNKQVVALRGVKYLCAQTSFVCSSRCRAISSFLPSNPIDHGRKRPWRQRKTNKMERAAPWINGYRESTAFFLGIESGRPAHDPKQAVFFFFFVLCGVCIYKYTHLTHVKKIPPFLGKGEKKVSIFIRSRQFTLAGSFLSFFFTRPKGVGNISLSVRRFYFFFSFFLFFTTRQHYWEGRRNQIKSFSTARGRVSFPSSSFLYNRKKKKKKKRCVSALASFVCALNISMAFFLVAAACLSASGRCKCCSLRPESLCNLRSKRLKNFSSSSSFSVFPSNTSWCCGPLVKQTQTWVFNRTWLILLLLLLPPTPETRQFQ